MRASGSNNPGIGAAEAAARAELRRRRASAYRHLRTPRKRGRVLRIVLIAITVFAAIGAGTVGAVFAGYNAYKGQLPDAATITNMEPQIDTNVYDNAGGLIHVFHNEGYRHIHEDLTQISPYFKDAIVAIEDHNFYTEGSWDLARLVESGVADVTHHGASLQGGSTITEQLAKISLYGAPIHPRASTTRSRRSSSATRSRSTSPRTRSSTCTSTGSSTATSRSASGARPRCISSSPQTSSTSPRHRCSPVCPSHRPRTTPCSGTRGGNQPARQVSPEGGPAGHAGQRLYHAGTGRRRLQREAHRPFMD